MSGRKKIVRRLWAEDRPAPTFHARYSRRDRPRRPIHPRRKHGIVVHRIRRMTTERAPWFLWPPTEHRGTADVDVFDGPGSPNFNRWGGRNGVARKGRGLTAQRGRSAGDPVLRTSALGQPAPAREGSRRKGGPSWMRGVAGSSPAPPGSSGNRSLSPEHRTPGPCFLPCRRRCPGGDDLPIPWRNELPWANGRSLAVAERRSGHRGPSGRRSRRSLKVRAGGRRRAGLWRPATCRPVVGALHVGTNGVRDRARLPSPRGCRRLSLRQPTGIRRPGQDLPNKEGHALLLRRRVGRSSRSRWRGPSSTA